MTVRTVPVARYRVPSLRVQLLFHAALIAIAAFLWQSLVDAGVLKAIVFGRPTVVVERLFGLLTNVSTFQAIGVTLTEVALGLSFGGLAGVAAGVLLSRFRGIRVSVDPLFLAIYTLPRIALIPLFIVWFGLGLPSKVAAVFIHGFVIFLLSTYATIDSVDRTLIKNLLMLGASRVDILTQLYMPWSSTFFFTAFRQALGLGIGTAVVAELIGSFDGVGYEIGLRVASFDMNGTLAWVILVATLAVVLDRIGSEVEVRLLKWR